MSTELIKRMPAILAAAPTTRARVTGEITVDALSIRKAAIDCGYTAPITNHQLRAAMVAAGGAYHTCGPRGVRYVFKGAVQKAEVLAQATASVRRALDQAEEV